MSVILLVLIVWTALSAVTGLILGAWLRSVSTEYRDELVQVEALRIGGEEA